jgi:uncharacterized protein (DUF58 family)
MRSRFPERLRQKLPLWLVRRRGRNAGIDRPLLDENRQQELRQYAESLFWSLIEFDRQASDPRTGEASSAFRGQGLEFEENRVYQPGDEPRLLNWRLYARTGELYTRVFREERRPQVFLLVDRRASMRFGSRRQLKAGLAAGLACVHAWQAWQQALALGGLILSRELHWFAPAVGDTAREQLLHSLSRPCHPLAFDVDQPGLEEALQWVHYRLAPGSFLLLVSDFMDLETDAVMPLLHELAQKHSVRAVQTLDPQELQLPERGDLVIENPSRPQPIRLDSRDQDLQQAYAEIFSVRQAQLAAGFAACHIPFHSCSTADKVESCLDSLRLTHDAG